MWKRVIEAGLLGAVVLLLATIVIDGLLGFRARIDMRQVAQEAELYAALKTHIDAPGRYVVNPPVTAERRFPAGEPVFSVFYGGVGHEAAGREMLLGLAVTLAACLIAAWLLSQTSQRVLASYPRKVLFVAAIGVLIALIRDVMSLGIGGYPTPDAAALAVERIVLWTLSGAAIAWRIRPEPVGSPSG